MKTKHILLTVALLSLGSAASAAPPQNVRPTAALSRTVAFDIPAQSLSSALLQFSTQSGVEFTVATKALEGRPLVIRTLDIGGDKPIPYLPLPAEENPALGLRGVRTSLWRPDLLRVQLRAILRVQPVDQCRVLLPMITDPAEIRAVRRMLDEVRRELGISTPVQVGAMIETPASAVIANRIAREVLAKNA